MRTPHSGAALSGVGRCGTEAFRATSLAAAALGAALAWLSISAARTDASSPARLVAELRLAQLAALLLVLVLVAGAYVGFAIAHETRVGTGLDISLTVGFFVIAAVATTQDPRVALTALALAFGAHAVVDVLHRGGVLSDNLAPAWYVTGCAIYDVLIAGLCYLPVLRR